MNREPSPFIQACPVGCTSDLLTTDILLPEGPLRRCTACGQLASMCSAEEYYDSMEDFDRTEGTTPVDRSSLKRLEKMTNKILTRVEGIVKIPRNDLSLLDVGCSSGAFISVAKKMGVDVTGVEPAEKPARAAKKSGLDVHNGLLEEIQFPDAFFTVITIFEVIEHQKDPIALMKECSRLLRPGGMVIIRTGNSGSWTTRFMKARWEYFHIARHGGHISFFNPVSIKNWRKDPLFLWRASTPIVCVFMKKGMFPV